ncbi:MAG: N-formylglutamate amidohydrolase [Myxococcota bacterium]
MIVTCEHASARIPRPLRTIPADRRWLDTHWAIDIGAANVARELVRRTGSMGILARFSRLVCDANRPVDDDLWIREQVEGHPLSFNQALTEPERTRRRETYWQAYHDTVDRQLGRALGGGSDVFLFAVHSFTPELDDETRDMELGVLFDRCAAPAKRLANLLRASGFRTALNEPYSGFGGMIFSVQRHGQAHGVVYLEIEVRQDLIATPAAARVIGRRLADALGHLGLRARRR